MGDSVDDALKAAQEKYDGGWVQWPEEFWQGYKLGWIEGRASVREVPDEE